MIFLFLVLGFIFAKFKIFNQRHFKYVHTLIIYFILPAVVLLQFHLHPFQLADVPLALSVWIQTGIAALLFLAINPKHLKIKKQTALALFFAVGYPNTSFIGFPLLNFFTGPEALVPAITIDQLGTFFSFAVVAVTVAEWNSGSSSIGLRIRKVLTNPATVALLVSILLSQFGSDWAWPASLIWILEKLNVCLSPFTLFAVGGLLKLNFKDYAHNFKLYRNELILGLSLRHLLMPAVILLVYTQWMPLWIPVTQFQLLVLVQEALMPPMLMASLLAIEKNFAPQLNVLLLELGLMITLIQLTLVKFFYN
jgi:predicted permease